MKVSIVGTGYVGLVTGVCLAEKSHSVLCVDVDSKKVDQINAGIPPVHEKGLDELLLKNIGLRLLATTDLEKSVVDTDITVVAVGTPFNGGAIDLSHIKAVAREIGYALRSKNTYHVIVVKSTVVPGTTDDVVRPLLEEASRKQAGADFGVGMNPEFLTEGEAIQDFMHPDRIVVGGMDEKTRFVLESLYQAFTGVPIVRTNNKTAEMIKYTSNALLATMISFSNEIGNLCAALGGADVVDVLKGVQLSKYLSIAQPNGTRIKPDINSFLWAGCGFGGSCLPKDVKALVVHGANAGTPMKLLNAVIDINEHQHEQVLALLRKHFINLEGIRVAVLGLAFRPDTDDTRESPAIPIVQELLRRGAAVTVYDPVVKNRDGDLFHNRSVVNAVDLAQAISNVDAVVLVTRWQEFSKLPTLLSQLDQPPIFIDGRRMLDKRSVGRYEGIGL